MTTIMEPRPSNKILTLFIHKDNQKILWHLIKKHPLFSKLSSTTNDFIPESWFKSIIQDCYESLSSPTSINKLDDLIHANKYAVLQLVKSMQSIIYGEQSEHVNKQSESIENNSLLSSTSSSSLNNSSGKSSTFLNSVSTNPRVIAEAITAANKTIASANSISTASLYDAPNAYQNIVLPEYENPDAYNPEKMKKEKEQQTVNEFNKLREKYEGLYSKPKPVDIDFSLPIGPKSDDDIVSLAKKQEEMRKADTQYLPNPAGDLSPDIVNKKAEEYFNGKNSELIVGSTQMRENKIEMYNSLLTSQ